MKIKFLYLWMAVAVLSSCAHALPYQSSQINPPSFWSRLHSSKDMASKKLEAMIIPDNNAQVEQDWWKHFKDPVLDQLIKESVQNNKTLGIARARVQEALANLAYGNADQMPDISFVGTGSRSNNGLATFYKPLNVSTAELQASWEIDIFGRNLPLLAQAKEMAQYADAMQQGVLVGLLSELGDDYFDLQNDKLQIKITQENLANQQKTLDLIKAQQKGAMASDFDVERAAAQVSTTESKLPTLRSAYDMTLNRINVLLGAVPGSRDNEIDTSMSMQPLDQGIIVAAPATVLANRPDVKAAERNFASSISNKSYAQKQFFPDISLLSFFGIEGVSKMAPVYPWSIGLTVVQPVMDFGRIEAQIHVARAQEHEAFLNYQQTVLEALEDMENALTGYKNEMVRNQLLRASVQENQRATDLAQRQYKSGFIGLLDVLVAQGNLLEAQSALADSDATLRKDLVHIYVASGGGWQIE